MLTQRDMDIALTEAKVDVRKLLEEWMEDYLGSRLDGDNRGRGEPAGAEAQATEGANIPQEEESLY